MAAEPIDIESAQQDSESFRLANRQENTRSRIAQTFIFGYLFVITMLIIITALGKIVPDVAKDYLLAIGSPLGFIIGYYFKSASD
jgi:hypothetical protein